MWDPELHVGPRAAPGSRYPRRSPAAVCEDRAAMARVRYAAVSIPVERSLPLPLPLREAVLKPYLPAGTS